MRRRPSSSSVPRRAKAPIGSMPKADGEARRVQPVALNLASHHERAVTPEVPASDAERDQVEEDTRQKGVEISEAVDDGRIAPAVAPLAPRVTTTRPDAPPERSSSACSIGGLGIGMVGALAHRPGLAGARRPASAEAPPCVDRAAGWRCRPPSGSQGSCRTALPLSTASTAARHWVSGGGGGKLGKPARAARKWRSWLSSCIASMPRSSGDRKASLGGRACRVEAGAYPPLTMFAANTVRKSGARTVLA